MVRLLRVTKPTRETKMNKAKTANQILNSVKPSLINAECQKAVEMLRRSKVLGAISYIKNGLLIDGETVVKFDLASLRKFVDNVATMIENDFIFKAKDILAFNTNTSPIVIVDGMAN